MRRAIALSDWRAPARIRDGHGFKRSGHVRIACGDSHEEHCCDFHGCEGWAGACRLFQESDIVELELKSKKFALALRKKEALEVKDAQVIYQVFQCFGPE